MKGRDARASSKPFARSGPSSFFVGSDSGLVGTPNHTDALVMAARVLRQNGFDERALDVMFKDNPARLLGLPTQ